MPMSLGFLSNERDGNVAMMAALTFPVCLGFLGGALDITIQSKVNNELQTAIDSAVLAASALSNPRDAEVVVEEYLTANLYGSEKLVDGMTVSATETATFNSRSVEVTVSGRAPTVFLGLVGIDSLPVTASATAFQSATEVEIALVLDISLSMNKNSKITNLQNAARSFVDEILGEHSGNYSTINLIPFGGTVNVGGLFDDFVVDAAPANTDPVEADYIDNAIEGLFRFTDGDECLEYPASAYDDAVFASNSLGQVSDFTRWNKNSRWCPYDSTAMVLNSTNAEALKTAITNFELSAGTGIDIGALWARKVLSPAWRGLLGGDDADRPADYDEPETMKVAIIMSDGEITSQQRPDEPPYELTNKKLAADVMFNAQDIGASVGKSNVARANLQQVCDDMKDDGILIYTIGFELTKANAIYDMEYCATNDSMSYLVENLEISTAFRSIASSINTLRLTQ